MKALLALKSAINQSTVIGFITLVTLVPVIYPETSLAANSLQTQGEKSLVFQIKDPNTIQQNQNSPTLSYDALASQDPLVVKLRNYLEQHNSPLAQYAAQIVTYPYWQRALGISLVESSMCVHTPKVKTKQGWIESYNCSGIGGNYYHIYTGYMDWFSGMNDLLGQPNYVNRPIEKFLHYYVQPGSPGWLYGVKKTEVELAILEKDAVEEKISQSQNAAEQQASQTTFPELALLTK